MTNAKTEEEIRRVLFRQELLLSPPPLDSADLIERTAVRAPYGRSIWRPRRGVVLAVGVLAVIGGVAVRYLPPSGGEIDASAEQDLVGDLRRDALAAEGNRPSPFDLATMRPDLDEVVEMESGGLAEPPSSLGENSEVLASRNLLVAPSPNGPIQVFDQVVRQGDKVSRCLVADTHNGFSLNCSAFSSRLDDNQELLNNASGGGPPKEMVSFLELVGPKDTTHFIVVIEGRHIGVKAVEGVAVLAVQGDLCEVLPTNVEAWENDRLVKTQPKRDWCD